MLDDELLATFLDIDFVRETSSEQADASQVSSYSVKPAPACSLRVCWQLSFRLFVLIVASGANGDPAARLSLFRRGQLCQCGRDGLQRCPGASPSSAFSCLLRSEGP